MPSLATDVLGQVARLPIRPTESNALLPLYEAISNSLHAVHERFGDADTGRKGKITIEVIRGIDQNVEGFRIADNGIGLDNDNYKSFCTPFSLLKIRKGGKGIGRLGWLKVFKNVGIQSTYEEDGRLLLRDFDFKLAKEEQIAPKENNRTPTGTGTTVELRVFEDSYGAKCPARALTIVQRVLGHFLPVFAGLIAPKIMLVDGETFDLKAEFNLKTSKTLEKLISVEVDGEEQSIMVRHMRCDKGIRPQGTQNNWLCFCANDRGVKEYGIDEQIGLKSLKGDHIYIGTVTGDFFDKHVNPQRTDFTFDAEDGRAIRRQVAASVKEFLHEEVSASLAQKKAIAAAVIQRNPQFIYMSPALDDFVQELAPNSNSEETIYLEMAQSRFRRQRKFSNVQREISKAPEFSEPLEEKIQEYKQYLTVDQKGSLAEYVVKRKAVLDLLDKLRGFAAITEEKQHLEKAIHQLICPMVADSTNLDIQDHNLWILDDRLAFFRFFASDLPFKNYTDVPSGKEPDIAMFYDSCIAWRESEKACDTVILVEFKRPGLEDYSDKNDPLMQLMDYVTLFQSGKTVRDRKGNVITGIGRHTAYHCYIVADITEGLKKRLRGRFDPTPDGRGLFGYTRSPDSYTEVIPYEKLFIDAHARNAIFFEKLGLNG